MDGEQGQPESNCSRQLGFEASQGMNEGESRKGTKMCSAQLAMQEKMGQKRKKRTKITTRQKQRKPALLKDKSIN
jgi:hypothetical protein